MSDDSDNQSDYDIEDEVTDVLLGFESDPIKPGDHVTFEDNRLGGQPVWINEDSIPESSFLRCKCCDKDLALLVQIYAPLESEVYPRVLYVFACQNIQCRRKDGSIRALRGVKRDLEEEKRALDQRNKEKEQLDQLESEKAQKEKDLSHALSQSVFNTEPTSNPFSTANPFASKEKTESKDSKDSKDSKEAKDSKEKMVQAQTKITKPHTSLPQFNESFISVETETLYKPSLPQSAKIDYVYDESEEQGDGSSSSAEAHLAEQGLAPSYDKTFQHFLEVVECNPEQVVRYQRPLKPLLYSDKDSGFEALKSLPEDRTVELQVMPYAIMCLEDQTDADAIKNGMEWGTIFIATSSSTPTLDENLVGYVEEWVSVQWEH